MESICPETHLPSDSAQLKKLLEWELSLDSRDLRSHAWYHGSIPRSRAETIIGQKDGNFLVRDCTTQPGNYVLSCLWRGQPIHFVINKIVLQQDTVYERIHYRFEEDGYDTVPDLITYYVGSGKAITAASGAKIRTPCNRQYPLSFYASRYEIKGRQFRADSPCSLSSSISQNLIISPKNVRDSPPPRLRRMELPPKLPARKYRAYSVAQSDADEVRLLGNGNNCVIDSVILSSFEDDKKSKCGTLSKSGRSSSVDRYGSEQTSQLPLTPTKPHRSISVPYPHENETTLRENELKHKTLSALVHQTSGSDSGNGSGDSMAGDSALHHNVSTLQRRINNGVVIRNPKYYCDDLVSMATPTSFSQTSSSMPQDLEFPSLFDLDNFHTLLLPSSENKPLDITALCSVNSLLREFGSRMVANHLTRLDAEIIVKDIAYQQLTSNGLAFACKSGLELCFLPYGYRLRLDLIERTQCLKLLVATTIITAATDCEKAEILNKWIEIAIDTKTAMGNLFGFGSIMLGLCMPQIQQLTSAWHVLRQSYTDSAFNFEAKLKPILKNMNECTNPLAPNTTIPHLIPNILMQDISIESIKRSDSEKSSLELACLTSWENSSSDDGLSTMLLHLQSGRQYCKSLANFKRNTEIVLADTKVNDLLLDVFRTEFQMKFLWGSKRATNDSEERYRKFENVLQAMSERCAQTDNDVTYQRSNDVVGYVTSVGVTNA